MLLSSAVLKVCYKKYDENENIFNQTYNKNAIKFTFPYIPSLF